MLKRLASLLLFRAASSTTAFEPSGSVWMTPQATFHVNIPGNSLSGGSWNDAFIRAMQDWTDLTRFEFSVISEFVEPCIGRGGDTFGDEKSSTNFTDTVCGTDYGENVLAVTLATLTCQDPDCTGTLIIEESDIVFNDAERWDIYSGPIQGITIDFERVALHELGHVIGLDHEATNDAIMRATLTDFGSLQTDDINGANFIYGGDVSLESIYGFEIKLPEPGPLEEQENTIYISGSLTDSDASVNDSAIDIYQLTFAQDTSITVDLNSSDFDPLLYLVRIDSTQTPIEEFVFSDDNSGAGSAARIVQDIPAGTYWFGATGVTSGSEGDYSITLSSLAASIEGALEEYQTIYGAEVQINPNPFIYGDLRNSDFRFEDKFMDIYQFTVKAETDMRFDLISDDFDTVLLLVEVLEDQSLGSLVLVNDDNIFGTNSRIEYSLPPGTYWKGVTSFAIGENGDYRINVSVNVN